MNSSILKNNILGQAETEFVTRIAIVNEDRCKPKKCQQECKKSCPVVRAGKLCIIVTPESKISFISEKLCIGCGICVQKCPFDAISIINLPTNLNKDTTHRYGPNGFKIHRLPVPRRGQVLGLVGSNGLGKSTALNILSGKLKPNLGNFQILSCNHKNPPDWAEIINHFKGSTLQSYFTRLVEDNLKTIIKPQYTDQIPRLVKGTVQENLTKYDQNGNSIEILNQFDLNHILNNQIEKLSGGELQRFACAIACLRKSDIYMFDEPSSFLDVKQRVKAAVAIRSLLKEDKYVIVVEHDLSILDFLSDFICLLYGSAAHYGVVTFPSSVCNGINHFMDGFIPSENMRFRDHSISFNISEKDDQEFASQTKPAHKYPNMSKTFDENKFRLRIESGEFGDSEIVVLFGENGTGKTTLIKILAGSLTPDENEEVDIPKLRVSYKPQIISPKFEGTLKQLLITKIRDAIIHPQFISDVLKPLDIPRLFDKEVINLSGGEIQRVALTICLGKPADVYLIDEPSAFLDAEQRVNAARVIKRFMRNSKKTAFIVEHDFIMATYLANRVIVFEGQPGLDALATRPQSLLTGINRFLKSLNITFRRDKNNFRPRINKLNGIKDIEQKKSGNYFFLD